MNRAEKSQKIIRILDRLHPETPIPLDHQNDFQLLIAVLMSAQTTDKKVNQVTPQLFAKGSNAEQMSQVSIEEIRVMIREVGLAPTKAKNIHNLSKILVENNDGKVPQTFEELENLPGVGHKTASVVMAQAFGVPAFPVDTHIHRLAARWGLSNGSNVTKTEKDLKAAFSRDLWNRLHLQIIFFGREHCPARNHDLKKCPICSWAATKKRIASEVK
ncbi:MAG TPA: endonuclease III [Candidatus Poseidoniales archaeon]|nr:MAG: endonuclease III [Euryarchaeota archaeon]HIF45870.1 endonuclease III [Candidatus Poseidoniales archaeon]HIL65015.1 endonuclease III [Candidatus Poseidoniales archaeon]